MKKKVILALVIIIALILLFPIPMKLKDGGSVEFRALLYSVTKYHRLALEETESGYIDGIKIEILGMKIYDSTDYIETKTETKERTKISDLKISNSDKIDTKQLVKFNNIVYGRSPVMLDYAGNLNNSIGTIDFLIDEIYFPELNGETNSEKILNAKVLEANEKTMVLNINNVAVLFEAVVGKGINEVNNDDKEYHSFVGTVLEETTTYMIVKPNEDEEEIKTADKIRINYGTDHIDYLYEIGRKVIIKYKGYIKETYPAQIDTNNILTDGYEEFELSVKKSESVRKKKILNNKELNGEDLDFDLYYYGLDEVNIFVDGKTMPLEDALKSGKMTIHGILAKANQDESNGIITCNMYDDGGSTEWYYENYTIIQCHSLVGNRDVYIGTKGMTINSVIK